MDRDSRDAYAWQALAISCGRPVGTGRIWWEEGAFHIGGICVLPDFRGHGFGDFLIRLLLFKAQQHYAGKVVLYAHPEAAPFFLRYGFVPCEARDQAGAVRHELAGESILLEACAGCGKKNAL